MPQSGRSRRAAHARLTHLVEHAHDLIYCCDAEGRLTYVNPAAARVLQVEPGELAGQLLQAIVRADEQDAVAARCARQIGGKIASDYVEFRAATRDGRLVWLGQHAQLILSDGRPAGLECIARDITRQKDTEERLRRSGTKYRSLIEGAAYGIYRSTLDGRILDANPAFAHMLGYASVAEVTALNIADVYRSPADRARLIASHDPARVGSAEAQWKRRDGTPLTVWLSARRVELEGFTGFEGIVQDITERHALELQLRQAQKMDAVQILARAIAHDFNNVLAAIMGCSDLLLLRLPRGDEAREDAAEIGRAADRGAALTRQLFAFSRRPPSDATPIDLAQEIANLRQTLEQAAGHSIALGIRTPPDALIVRAELSQVEQILLNLVVNGRDAMPDGGRLDVEVDEVDMNSLAMVAYTSLRPGEYARIAVRDTGSGIAADVQARVFEPFFTTKDHTKSTGLGLSIVYSIVRDLGGTVTFSTAPGRGTTFEVLLPVAASTSEWTTH